MQRLQLPEEGDRGQWRIWNPHILISTTKLVEAELCFHFLLWQIEDSLRLFHSGISAYGVEVGKTWGRDSSLGHDLGLPSPVVQSAGSIPHSSVCSFHNWQAPDGIWIIDDPKCKCRDFSVLGKTVCCWGWNMRLGVEAWVLPCSDPWTLGDHRLVQSLLWPSFSSHAQQRRWNTWAV